MEQFNSHANSNSNTKRQNKNRKKRNKRNKTKQTTNGVENNKFTNESPTFMSMQDDNQQASSPRPKNLCRNNFNSDNKRSSGSEVEEFHTPNCEYPEFPNKDVMKENENSYDKEWDDIGNFHKSNLEGIPEKDYALNFKAQHFTQNSNGIRLSKKEFITSHENNFKYRPMDVKRNKRCNGDVRKQYTFNGEALKDTHCSMMDQEINNHIINYKFPEPESITENIDENGTCQPENINDYNNLHLAQSNNENQEDKHSNYSFVVTMENNLFETYFEEEISKNNICMEMMTANENDHSPIVVNDNNQIEIELKEKENDGNAIVKDPENSDYNNPSCEEELTEDISISTTREKIIYKELVIEEKVTPTKCENNEENDHDRCAINDENMENIHCIDENLEAEILHVPIIKMNILWKSSNKHSFTLGARDLNNSHRQSATTITNVTSISDENLNMSDENDIRKIKNQKKRNKFVRIIFSKFKKPKTTPKMETNLKKDPNDEYPIPINNEYFDDASIDCNSHAKTNEIDSNKALKSYDDSINNSGDTKHIEEEFGDKFEINEKINIENEFKYTKDLGETETAYPEETRSQINVSLKDLHIGNESDGEKATSIKSVEIEKLQPEKSKKNRFFSLCSRKKNKTSPKIKLNDITCEQPRKNYICSEIKDDGANKELKEDNKDIKIVVVENLESPTNETVPMSTPAMDLNHEIETFDKSFAFLNDFEKESIKEEMDKLDDKEVTVDECKKPDSPNIELLVKSEDDHLTLQKDSTLNIRCRDKFSQIDSPTIPEKSKNQNPKDKHKKKYFTIFSNKKQQKLEKAKSYSNENIGEEKFENGLKNEKKEIDDEHFQSFHDVLKSLGPTSKPIENEKVVSKNKNDYPLAVDRESVTNQTVSYINDDHLFPDALTPSKIVQYKSNELYDFPFIDDPKIVEEDDLKMFKGETKRPLILSEFSAPFASSETLFISDKSEDNNTPGKSISSLRSTKGPLSGLINLISRGR